MADRRYETVIIGAGPAGMGAAIPLQKAHRDVCVLDRASFPRNKTCAGLVTLKTYRLIDRLYGGNIPEGLFCCTSEEVRLYRRTQLLVSAPLKRPVHLVNRREFDNALVEEYKRLGGVLYEGEARLCIDYDADTVTLSDGSTIAYDNLLFADGALSKAHHLISTDKRKMALGIEAYLPSSALAYSSVGLYFGYLDDGYVWVFPHGDTVCIGAANLYDKKTDYRGLLTGILNDLGVSPDGVKYIGAFLPYGEVIDQERLPDNVMLLGDAGGFTDPISGEGLYMALQSGDCAAQAIAEAHPKAAYLDAMQAIVRIVNDGKKAQKTFYSPMIQKIFTSTVKGRSGLVAYFFEQMVEDYRCEYRDIRKLLTDYKKQSKE